MSTQKVAFCVKHAVTPSAKKTVTKQRKGGIEKMRTVNYEGKQIRIPETVNGQYLRQKLGIPRHRTLYMTELDGKSTLVNDGKNIVIRENQQPIIGDLPYTTKG